LSCNQWDQIGSYNKTARLASFLALIHADEGVPGEAVLRENLKAVRREIRAVETALEAIDEATQATGEGDDVDGGPDSAEAELDRNGRPQKDRSLQRAGLAQRLSDLLAKKQQWKARPCLSTLETMARVVKPSVGFSLQL